MSRKVLVVEDDGATRESLRRVLEGQGWTVDEAADGETAVRQLSQHHYGAIVLDIVLPRLSGTGVMQYIARTTPGKLRSVVVVTGLEAREIRKLFPTICDTLCKPVMPARLINSFRRCFGSGPQPGILV